MQKKAPQGKPDPIPTPEQELERYGVWVKAEPQDVVDEPMIAREPLYDVPAVGSDAVLLSEEEEEILDSFDLPEEPSESLASTDTVEDIDEFDDLEALDPLEEPEALEAAVDDEPFDFEAFDSLESPEAAPPKASKELDAGVVEDSVIDVELDDLDYEEPEAVTRPEPDAAPSGAAPSGDYSTTEINIEDFGFEDDESPANAPSLEDRDLLIDASDPIGASLDAAAPPTEEFESLDMDLEFDDTIPSAESAEPYDAHADDAIDVSSEFETIDIDSIGVEAPLEERAVASPATSQRPVAQPIDPDMSGISLDSFIDDEDPGSSGVVPDLEIENVSLNDQPIGFDDVSAVSDDLSSRPTEPPSDLLQKIAFELSSIKEELVSLRGQLSSLKAANAAVPASEERPEIDAPEETAPGGFFDDEDDDTIALTGDELDNILNTADFTEESVDDESPDELDDSQLDIPEDIELLPEDGDYSTLAESGIETIDLPVVEPTMEELDAIADQAGVTPLTSLPEDTSFLDAPDDDISELEGMPLEDVPLVEPDPSDLDIIIDSTFGNDDEELPVIEAVPEELEPEIVLDMDADAEPVVSTVDAFPEALEEIDDPLELEELLEPEELGGFDLHSEEAGAALATEQVAPAQDTTDAADDLVAPLPDASEPVGFHPDELPTSLDDSLFVETVEPVDDIEEIELDEMTELEPEPEPEQEPILEAELEPEAVVPSEIAAPPAPSRPEATSPLAKDGDVPDKLKRDVKSVLVYLDQLLASLPEEKIEEFASSEYYDTYKRLFDDLGLL